MVGNARPTMGTVDASDTAELEADALHGIWSIERFLFGASIKRNVRNKRSRFFSLLPKYGPRGSATLIAANLWLLPGIILLIPSVVLNVVSTANSPVRLVSYVLLALSIGCFLLMIVRALMATRFRTANK
jgi:hypothetical protein